MKNYKELMAKAKSSQLTNTTIDFVQAHKKELTTAAVTTAGITAINVMQGATIGTAILKAAGAVAIGAAVGYGINKLYDHYSRNTPNADGTYTIPYEEVK